MFFKNFNQPNYQGFDNTPKNNNQMNNPNTSSYYPNYQYEKLQYEIKENRRRINNLAKRIMRIENYLRIRDSSDYPIIEDDTNFPI